MIWENVIETCTISYGKRIASPGSMHDTGCLGLVHWDDPEGWYGEGGGRGVAGYVDSFRHVHGDVAGAYSWWSYKTRARERNIGWRLDYFFVSSELRNNIRDAWIENDVYGSDHCPVGLALEL